MTPLPLPSLSHGGGLPPTACGPATSKTPAEVGVSRVLDLTGNTEAGRGRRRRRPGSRAGAEGGLAGGAKQGADGSVEAGEAGLDGGGGGERVGEVEAEDVDGVPGSGSVGWVEAMILSGSAVGSAAPRRPPWKIC